MRYDFAAALQRMPVLNKHAVNTVIHALLGAAWDRTGRIGVRPGKATGDQDSSTDCYLRNYPRVPAIPWYTSSERHPRAYSQVVGWQVLLETLRSTICKEPSKEKSGGGGHANTEYTTGDGNRQAVAPPFPHSNRQYKVLIPHLLETITQLIASFHVQVCLLPTNLQRRPMPRCNCVDSSCGNVGPVVSLQQISEILGGASVP